MKQCPAPSPVPREGPCPAAASVLPCALVPPPLPAPGLGRIVTSSLNLRTPGPLLLGSLLPAALPAQEVPTFTHHWQATASGSGLPLGEVKTRRAPLGVEGIVSPFGGCRGRTPVVPGPEPSQTADTPQTAPGSWYANASGPTSRKFCLSPNSSSFKFPFPGHARPQRPQDTLAVWVWGTSPEPPMGYVLL